MRIEPRSEMRPWQEKLHLFDRFLFLFPSSLNLSAKMEQVSVCNHWCCGIHQFFQVFLYFKNKYLAVWYRVVDFYLSAYMKQVDFLHLFKIEVKYGIHQMFKVFISKMSSRLASKMPASMAGVGVRSLAHLWSILHSGLTWGVPVYATNILLAFKFIS